MLLCIALSAHDNAVATLSGHISWVLSVACSPEGRQFATGCVCLDTEAKWGGVFNCSLALLSVPAVRIGV